MFVYRICVCTGSVKRPHIFILIKVCCEPEVFVFATKTSKASGFKYFFLFGVNVLTLLIDSAEKINLSEIFVFHFTNTQTILHIHIHIHTFTHAYGCTHSGTLAYMYTHPHIWTHKSTRVHTCMHTHAHTHTHRFITSYSETNHVLIRHSAGE